VCFDITAIGSECETAGLLPGIELELSVVVVKSGPDGK
jgi:hypothetical protein